MKKIAILIYKIVRSIVVTSLLAFLTIYTTLYILLSIPAIQNKVREFGEEELSKLFNTNVKIGEVEINPLNEVTIYDVEVPDQTGKEMIRIRKIGAGASLSQLIFNGRIVFDYAEIIGLDGKITKADPESLMNINFLIEAFKPKQKNKPPTKFDVALNAVIIRQSQVSFDILSEPRKTKGLFDKNHICIQQFNSDIRIPVLKNDNFTFDIRRFAFKEISGFTVNNLSFGLHIDKKNICLKNFLVELPNTAIHPADISLNFSDLKRLKEDFKTIPLKLSIIDNTVSLADFKSFIPAFVQIKEPLQLTITADGNFSKLNLRNLKIKTDNEWLSIQTAATISNLDKSDSLSVNIPNIRLSASIREVAQKIKDAGIATDAVSAILAKVERLSINGQFDYTDRQAKYVGYINTDLGNLATNGTFNFNNGYTRFSGKLSSKTMHLAKLPVKTGTLGDAAFDIHTDMNFGKGRPSGTITGNIQFAEVKGYKYENIATDIKIGKDSYEGFIRLHDKNINLDISGLVALKGKDSKFDTRIVVANAGLYQLNLIKKHPNHHLGVNLTASFSGNSIDNIEGDVVISDIRFIDEQGNGVSVDHLDITARQKKDKKYITVNSDLINGYIDGVISAKTIVPELKSMLATSFPALKPSSADSTLATKRDRRAKREELPSRQNDFSYFFRLAENDELTRFFNLPVSIVHPITISGKMSTPRKELTLGLEAPYFMQKNKIIEKTSLAFNIDGQSKLLTLNAATQLDNKNGNILLLLNGLAVNNRLDTDIAWQFDREADFSGKISLSSLLKKNEETNAFETEIDINPSKFVVNDTIWNVEQSKIRIAGKKIYVDNVDVNRELQFIKANGIISDNQEEKLSLHLRDIDLSYIFETLRINHVVFGGQATGDFFASGLLSKTPKINTDNLNVKHFSYHNAPLGEADISSHWDNENKGIVINADIHQYNHRQSFVNGTVFLGRDSLAFKFDADHINVQILKPFMSAFTTDVTGEASGHAELFGTFKLIDLKGRLFADKFRMRVDQTNTYYSVSDSIIIDPGIIRIKDATIRDDFGNTALLNGAIRHTYFKNAEFNFDVTNVTNMLCFNTTEKQNPFWYGKIFGTGSAYIDGRPGNVRIDVNMAAAPNSSFNFVLSDQEQAGEYTFVTFTDKRKEEELKRKEAEKPAFLKKIEKNEANNQAKSDFHINLLVDANPNVAITLVMDPQGGDRIRAKGNGNMRIEYSSSDEMKMFGNYTVDEGRYNFTLQDIIVREFKIKQGANISFHGNPLDAVIDLNATYSVNANLTDLDESFSLDKDLTRTMVPVNALLKLSGPISQPNIGFDLEFPTLTQDVYRKVRSIINTDDMMNQQIIYLLALNRFYTPEYMGNTNRNNELAAVASSTISSQLSSILGQLNDNWTIAPNFHSDKGDFSDTEVELALSSHLLNNRLLLNGNFGYSDNSMNNNNFIGDFDIEYLLTKSGNFRLKAYNRYNDQNYYIRNALTTQGVGIVFKHDFDRLFKKRKKDNKKSVAPNDSLKQRNDTILLDNRRKPVARQ